MQNDLYAAAKARMEAPDDASFLIRDGEGCVMFSAPHCVKQWREGREKFAEPETGVLAEMLHLKLCCPIIRKQTFCHDDANWDAECGYKDALAAYAAAHGILCLVDLHQMAAERPEMICIGTDEGRNVEHPLMAEKILSVFQEKGISSVHVDHPFKASCPHTVSAAIHRRLGIPCIQLEINSRLLRRDFDEYALDTVFDCLCAVREHITEMVK